MRRVVWLLLLAACQNGPEPRDSTRSLRGVRSWAIQLQEIGRDDAAERLVAAEVDLVVIEPTRTVRGQESFPTRDLVGRIKDSGKLCLAYFNVGQAEDYRTYWPPYWTAPTKEGPGKPTYLLGLDPEGWVGNYPVAYWDVRWRSVLWGGAYAPLDQILADGFDGVFLDWVLGYVDETVAAAARRTGVDPAREMAALVRDLREYARRKRPGFLIIAQNCAALPERVPEFTRWIDAVSQEDLTFRGAATAKWDDPASGDRPTPAARTGRLAKQLQGLGLPVFTLDYALQAKNIERARAVAAEHGFIPCVSRTPLDRLP